MARPEFSCRYADVQLKYGMPRAGKAADAAHGIQAECAAEWESI